MGIVNTRNAVVGWAVLETGKYAIKHKAKETAKKPGRVGAWAAGSLAAAAFVGYKARKRGRRTSEPE